MKAEILLSRNEIEALKAKAMNAVISEAVRAYLKRHTGRDKPLPYENLAGRDDYPAETPAGTLFWTPPDDLAGRLSDNAALVNHIRAAIREYLRPPAPEPLPKPIPPAQEEMIEIFCKGSVKKAFLQAAKDAGMTWKDYLEKIVRDYCISLKGRQSEWRGTGKGVGCGPDDYISSLKLELTPSLRRMLPGAGKVQAEFIQRFLDQRFGGEYV